MALTRRLEEHGTVEVVATHTIAGVHTVAVRRGADGVGDAADGDGRDRVRGTVLDQPSAAPGAVDLQDVTAHDRHRAGERGVRAAAVAVARQPVAHPGGAVEGGERARPGHRGGVDHHREGLGGAAARAGARAAVTAAAVVAGVGVATVTAAAVGAAAVAVGAAVTTVVGLAVLGRDVGEGAVAGEDFPCLGHAVAEVVLGDDFTRLQVALLELDDVLARGEAREVPPAQKGQCVLVRAPEGGAERGTGPEGPNPEGVGVEVFRLLTQGNGVLPARFRAVAVAVHARSPARGVEPGGHADLPLPEAVAMELGVLLAGGGGGGGVGAAVAGGAAVGVATVVGTGVATVSDGRFRGFLDATGEGEGDGEGLESVHEELHAGGWVARTCTIAFSLPSRIARFGILLPCSICNAARPLT